MISSSTTAASGSVGAGESEALGSVGADAPGSIPRRGPVPGPDDPSLASTASAASGRGSTP